MRTNIQKQIILSVDREDTYGWVPIAMLAAGVPLGILVTYSLMGEGAGLSVAFGAVAGWTVLLAIGYLGLQSLSGAAWYSLPILLTIEGVLEFVCVPAWRFAAGDDVIDPVYVHAMTLTLLGFSAFWAGSLISKREARIRFVPQIQDASARVVFMSGAMLVLGVIGNVIVWKLGLSLYLNTTDKAGLHDSYLPLMGWLTFCSGLLQSAMVVSGIEVLGKRSHAPLIRQIFWLSLLSIIGFGLISAMKGALLFPLIFLVLIYAITRGRVPRSGLVIPLLLLPIYPFVTAYRANLNSAYRADINTLGGLEAVLGKSFADAFNSPFSTSDDNGVTLDQAGSRLDLLTDVHDIIGLPDPSLLNGDEKIWLAPIYPLVPRLLWKDKPVFDKGVRLSIALGRGNTTSSAPTQIGDLYTLFGTPGIVIGMFVYGLCLQVYMNWMSGSARSERALFFYISILFPLIGLEQDSVAFVGTLVQTGITLLIMQYIIYGRPDSSRHLGRPLPPTRTI